MTKKRKIKADTASGAVSLMNTQPPELPSHIVLNPPEILFFNAIIKAKAHESWNDVDLDVAANLARAKAKIERLEGKLTLEEDVVVNGAGSPIANPKFKMIEDLVKKVIALTRLLQIHPLATVGQSADQRKKNQQHKELQNIKNEEDDLFASPVQ